LPLVAHAVCLDRPDGGRLAAVTASSDRAEISSLRAQVAELSQRVTAVAERYDDTADSAIAADLFAAERALLAAVRTLERAEGLLADSGSREPLRP
jgi:hypothetical protein